MKFVPVSECLLVAVDSVSILKPILVQVTWPKYICMYVYLAQKILIIFQSCCGFIYEYTYIRVDNSV